jgi:hypothetical protein
MRVQKHGVSWEDGRMDEGRYAVWDRRRAGRARTQVYRVTRTPAGVEVRAEFGTKAPLVARWTGQDGLVAVGDSGPRHHPLVTELLAAPRAARALFAQTTGRCGRCNRRLSNSGSIAAGLGPECRQQVSCAA